MSIDIHRPVLANLISYAHQPENLINMSLVCKRWKKITEIVCKNLLRNFFGIEVEQSLARRRVCEMTHILNDIFKKNYRLIFLLPKISPSPPLESIFDLPRIQKYFRYLPGQFFQPKHLKIFTFNAILSSVDDTFPENSSAQLTKTALIRTCGNLYLAAKQNNYKTTKYFLDNYEVSKGEIQEAFLPACQVGNLKMVKLFMENGVDVTAEKKPFEKETYLTAACKSRNIPIARLLVGRGADTEAANNKNETPLSLAARVSTQMFKIFSLIAPTLSNTYGTDDNTIAHYAAQSKRDTSKVILECVSRDAPIDQTNIYNVTPLMLAIKGGNMEAFYTLIECGADIEAECNMGMTPLHYAVVFKRSECLRFLCEQEPSKATQLSALKMATLRKNFSAINILTESTGIQKVARVATLVGAGALALFAWLNLEEE